MTWYDGKEERLVKQINERMKKQMREVKIK